MNRMHYNMSHMSQYGSCGNIRSIESCCGGGCGAEDLGGIGWTERSERDYKNYASLDNPINHNRISYSLAASLPAHNSCDLGNLAIGYSPNANFSNFTGQYGFHSNGYNNYSNSRMRTIAIDYHNPENMLNPFREEAQFVADAKDIESLIKEAFRETMGEAFPEHIKVSVLKEEAFRRAFNCYSSGNFSQGIQGFAIHNKNKVFVKAGKLDKVMVVLGHEIGHVLTHSLSSILDEEAKAFSFEKAWLNAVINKNIGDIADNINLNFIPASNGVHDVAFRFVQRRTKEKSPLSLFFELCNGFDSVIELAEN